MGLYVGFDVADDFGFIGETETYGIVPDYDVGCEIFCDVFEDVATTLVPVDTGYLQSTIVAGGGGSFCECEAFAEYAQYVEYGTWRQRAQPYFEVAVQAGLDAAEQYWAQAELEALEEEWELLEEAIESEYGQRIEMAENMLEEALIRMDEAMQAMEEAERDMELAQSQEEYEEALERYEEALENYLEATAERDEANALIQDLTLEKTNELMIAYIETFSQAGNGSADMPMVEIED